MAASAPEKLLLAAPRGYCAGVDRAVQTVERALELHGAPVYVRKEIVHNKHVVEQLRARGAVFPATVQTGILDDHTPFLDAGIPAIDLIDFSYRYADTTRDTVDKLSERSLDAVGESTLELLRELRAG